MSTIHQSPPLLDLAALLALAETRAADLYSPLHDNGCLLARIDGDSVVGHAQQSALAAWLGSLPCPTIAIGADHPVLAHFDVVLSDNRELPTLLNTIANAPLAAMTLVQVLRATPALPLEQGLLLESLGYATLQGGPEFRRWSAANPPRIAQPMDTPPLELERADEQLYIRLNRPERRNAISVELRDALSEIFQLIIADESLRRVHISGNGACFSVGGDIDEFGSAPDSATAHAVRSVRLPARYLLQCAARVEFHLHSACIGAGIELPAFAQRVSAARNAFFQLPELRFGLIPGAGGCVSLPRRIGRQRTAYMALSGKKINAATALSWGLIDEIVG